MANEIRIKVVAEDAGTFAAVEAKAKEQGKRTGDEFGTGLDDSVGRRSRSAGEKAGKDLGSEVGRSLNTLLRDLRLPEIDVKADARDALAKLAETRLAVKALRDDKATVEVKVRSERALGELDKFAKSFVSEGEDVGKNFAQKMSSSVGEFFSSGGSGPMVAGIAAAVAVVSPAIGATIAGAVIGGVGLGGIAGGVALAAQDPKVVAAFSGMRATITAQLKDAATPFVDTSLEGIHKIGNAIHDIDFVQIFNDAAGQAGPVIEGIATAVTALGKGIADVIHNAGPVVHELGNDIGEIGKSLGEGLSKLSGDSEQGADALHKLTFVLTGVIDSTFSVVDGLSKIYGWLDKISGGGALNSLESVGNAMSTVSQKTRAMGEGLVKEGIPVLDKYGNVTDRNVQSLLDMANATDTLASTQLNLFGSVTSLAKAEANATKAARENGRTLDANTDKGRANRDALEGLGRSLLRNVQDYIAVNGAGQASQRVMANNRAAFLRAAESMTKSRKEAEALTDAIFGIPDKDVTIRVHQVSDGREIVDASGHRYGGWDGRAHGGVSGAAGGGARSGLTWVGERGPELLRLPPGTAVTTNGDSMRAMGALSGAGGGGGLGSSPLEINLMLDGSVLATAMLDPQRNLVRTRFGGDVQAAYGRG